jgi:tetratricopeptide (TPR) repeat protein
MKMKWISIVLTLVAALPVGAAPFTPPNDQVVLERLRTKPLDAATLELRQLRRQLRANPQNIALAAAVAKRYIEKGRQEADPRYNGYAQAALAPWWTQPQPPPTLLVLRATLRQSSHDFKSALGDLALVLQRNPNDGQAWVTKATIEQVQGNYAEAKQSCAHLLQLTSELVTLTCLSNVVSLNGQAKSAFTLLQQALVRNPKATSSEKIWTLTTLAEIAQRLNQPQVAEQYFKQAFILEPDSYLKGAYADFLLDQKRPQEVITLLKAETRADNLLLRLALAEKMTIAPLLANHINALKDRFMANRLRGDTSHLREEARFTLELLAQPQAALKLAETNWQIQKEPADAEIYLKAALAARQPKAAIPVLTWLNESRLEHVKLMQLKQQLAGV